MSGIRAQGAVKVFGEDLREVVTVAKAVLVVCDVGGHFLSERAAMSGRHDISDENWNRICPFLPGQAGGHGGVGFDTRLFVNAIVYLAVTGIA